MPKKKADQPSKAYVELRGATWCVVIRKGDTATVVGRHTARYKAVQQADQLNAGRS